MSLLSWFDNRTLISCQILLTAIYTLAFFGMKRVYPHLRGTGTFGSAFFFGFIGSALVAARGSVPDFISIVVSNALVFIAFALFHSGTLRFFHIARKPWLVWAIVAASTLVLTWFTLVHNYIVPRIYVIGLALFFIRGFTAIELFRQAAGRSFLKLFGVCMTIYALFGLVRIFFTMLHPAPSEFMLRDPVQTPVLILNIVFVSTMGLLFLSMLSGELVARLEDQSTRDLVSGALNRRGIEKKLELELDRAERGSYNLSVALLDIDHFKQINDTSGHAAGDAALRQVVTAISSHMRSDDLLGRYGGDEFLIVLPKTSWNDAIKVTDRIEHALNAILTNVGPITLSIGITQALAAEDQHSLLARADQALYGAKRAGRNCSRAVLPGDLEISTFASTSRLMPIAPASTTLIQ